MGTAKLMMMMMRASWPGVSDMTSPLSTLDDGDSQADDDDGEGRLAGGDVTSSQRVHHQEPGQGLSPALRQLPAAAYPPTPQDQEQAPPDLTLRSSLRQLPALPRSPRWAWMAALPQPECSASRLSGGARSLWGG